MAINCRIISDKGHLPEKGTKPEGIPSNVHTVYKNQGWVSWGDWLGTGTIGYGPEYYRPFEEAREFARSLGLNSSFEWEKFAKGQLPEKGARPKDIPAKPVWAYKIRGWVSWPDWLGTTWRSFEEAREFVQGLGLKNRSEWFKYANGEMSEKVKRPQDIPYAPSEVYWLQGWVSWDDWLGTGRKRRS